MKRDTLGRFYYSRGRCAVQPCNAIATDILGARPACAACIASARAFLAGSAERHPKLGSVAA